MKKNLTCLFAGALSLCITTSFAQNVAINEDGSAPNPNAILDVKSFTKGVLIPRVSTAGRLAIPNTKGLMVYDTTTSLFWYNTGTAWQSFSQGATGWLLTGNSGTDTTNFIGTTDNKPLLVKVNNLLSGRIDPKKNNTMWGYNAGPLMTDSILPDSAGHVRGVSNTALGAYALSVNLYGESNTATGFRSLKQNTYGIGNTANGFNALMNNVSGWENTAIGTRTLASNTTGDINTGIGTDVLSANTTGGFNMAAGYAALSSNISGFQNTAIGAKAMALHKLGNFNTAIGASALASDINGTNNTALGAAANVSKDSLTNATAVGAGAIVNASNKVRIGNSAVTVIEGQVPFTTPSDGRFKYHVQEDVKGIDFIMQLRPVTYQFDVKRFDDQQRHSSGDASSINNVIQASYNEAAAIRRSGFIAQEVEKAADASGYNFSGIIKPKTEQEHYSLSYESFVVPLVKAVQEQQKIIAAQNQKIAGLQQDIQTLAALKQQVAELNQLVQSIKQTK